MAILKSILKPRTRAVKKSASSSASTYDSQAQASLEELYMKIQHKAYELYEQRGRASGFECEDWLQAERLVTEEYKKGAA